METVGPAQGEKKAHLHISLGSTRGWEPEEERHRVPSSK